MLSRGRLDAARTRRLGLRPVVVPEVGGDATAERLLGVEALEEGGDGRTYRRKESVQVRRVGFLGQAIFKDIAEVIWDTQ